MIVLSLFDGLSCGQIALNRANIKVDKYYASEIDKYAIQVTQANYPETIQLGSITEWKTWDIEKPDLVMSGSPCQGFSFAGKQLNFEDERSKLFFVFVDILKYYKPKYFLLENVKMKKEYENVISKILDIDAIEINSSLVSAQNRKRLYWSNIKNIAKPDNKKIYLKDIIENGVVDRNKSHCIDANYFKGGNLKQYFEKSRRQLVFSDCIQTGIADLKVNVRAKTIDSEKLKFILIESKKISKLSVNEISKKLNVKKTTVDHWFRSDKCFAIPESNIWFELKKLLNINTIEFDEGMEFLEKDNSYSMATRTYDINGKSPTLTAVCGGHQEKKITTSETTWRKLTPIEYERLQTVPDFFTNHVSNSQRYKMLGNGFTVDVIVHILKNMGKQ